MTLFGQSNTSTPAPLAQAAARLLRGEIAEAKSLLVEARRTSALEAHALSLAAVAAAFENTAPGVESLLERARESALLHDQRLPIATCAYAAYLWLPSRSLELLREAQGQPDAWVSESRRAELAVEALARADSGRTGSRGGFAAE